MKITLIKVKNFQGVREIEIAPGDRNLILIAGKNRQGKSSLLRAMSAALGGGKESPDMPVRAGEEAAEITIELDGGEIVVTKSFHAKGKASLEVRSGKLGRLTSPQAILDGIVGTRFLDPLTFTRLSSKEQREKLLEVVDIGIDLDDHAKKRQEAFVERTNVNRDGKRLAAEIGAFEDPGEIPAKKDLAALLKDLEALQAKDAKAKDAKAAIAEHDRITDSATRMVSSREGELDTAKAALKDAKSALDKASKTRLGELPDLEKASAVDSTDEISKVKAELTEVDAHNDSVAKLESAHTNRARLEVEIGAARAESKRLSDALKDFDKAKADALAAATMPVAGLDLDDSAVLLNGVPLSQASGAEQLQLSLAIAASTRPELRDIWIEDGALLDGDSLKLVSEFAGENDLRVWLERVGETDDDCIIIEEGAIKANSD